MIKKSLQGYRRVLKEGFLDLLYGLIMKGIESFLVLYLTTSLLFPDQEAFDFLGAKSVIYYSIPFVMAFVSKHLFSVMGSVFIGLFYMALGVGFLAIETPVFLSIGMGFLTCGYGIGRPAIPLMVSEKKESSQKDKNDDIGYLYAFGNVASIVGPIILALIGHYTNWKTVFLTLLVACLLGAIVLYFMSPKLQRSFFNSDRFSAKNCFLIVLTPLGLALIIHFQSLKWFLTGGTAIWASVHLRQGYLGATPHTRLILKRLFLLWPCIIVFFIFQNQEFFVMPLYIERFVPKDFAGITFQTPWFHSINPFMALLATPFLTRIRENFSLKGNKITLPHHILMAFILLFSKFFFMALSTHLGRFAPVAIIIAYASTGVGIILLVPTTYQNIVRVKESGLKRMLIGSLYLMMVFAYLGTTLISHFITDAKVPHTFINYREIFYGFSGVTCSLFIGFFFFFRFFKKKDKSPLKK